MYALRPSEMQRDNEVQALPPACDAAAMAQGGRLCVAAAAGEGAPRGILLGASDSGGMQYIEPPAAVPLNNELGAARAEAAAAEEAVLWRLTGRLADVDADLQRALDVVRSQLGCLPSAKMLAGLPNKAVFHAF